MDNQSPETDWGSLFREALRALIPNGPIERSHPVQTDSDSNLGSQVGESTASAIGGPTLQCGDCETQGLSIDDLHFQRIGYGDTIRSNLAIRREMGHADDTEKNQRTLIHAAEALERLNHLQTKRVKELALELRQCELSLSGTITENIVTAETAVGKELVSLCHDVLAPCHDRDFRTIGLLVLPGLGNPPGLIIRVVHIDGPCSVAYGREFSGKTAPRNTNIIYLLAYKQHMRWLEPSDLAIPEHWKSWRGVCIRSVAYQSRMRQDYIEQNVKEPPMSLVACRFCRKRVKTSIDCDSFGSDEAIPGNFNDLRFDPPVGGNKGNWAFVGECGSAPFQQAGGGTRVLNVSFPLGEVNWRPSAEPSPETLAYYYHCASADSPLEKIQKLVGLGDD